jgi:steroid delta-isomerase-like uncharacterized protein
MATALRRIFDELWNGKNRAVIDELISPEYLHHDVLSPDCGIDGYKQFVEQYLTAFPDIRITIHDEIVAGDAIVARWTATGTQNGNLMKLSPTGNRLAVTGITIARVKDGKIVESWNNWDALGMMRQLGAIPSDATNRAA